MIESIEKIEGPGWFYEQNGERKGPITESEINELIRSRKITYGASVWKKGLPDWQKIEDTDLRHTLAEISAPPLRGESINNTIAWVLAFAPLIGEFIEYLVAGAIRGDKYLAVVEVKNGSYWYITFILTIILGVLDERALKKAGHDTRKFRGWVWLVPVYLFQRAKALKQNLALFFVWMGCMLLVLFDIV